MKIAIRIFIGLAFVALGAVAILQHHKIDELRHRTEVQAKSIALLRDNQKYLMAEVADFNREALTRTPIIIHEAVPVPSSSDAWIASENARIEQRQAIEHAEWEAESRARQAETARYYEQSEIQRRQDELEQQNRRIIDTLKLHRLEHSR